MKIRCVSIGKTTSKEYQVIVADYVKRLQHYTQFEYAELAGLKKFGNASMEQIKVAESEVLMKEIQKNDYVILLDDKGFSYSSMQLAQQLEKWRMMGNNLLFIIGGAYGFSDELYKKAHAKLSLSSLTLTHQMVRILFTEQLYRAHTILANEKYHHE
jgi:23S rRNA (pseudouridine1915-N3)-methyltransferase